MVEPRLILIVDDDPGIRNLLTYALTSEGYRVAVAENGRLALDRLAVDPPDLILLDMNMPVMDGLEFLAAYSAQPGPHRPVIAFTAGTRHLRIDPELTAPLWLRIITKPFDLDELYAMIQRAWPANPGAGPPRRDDC